MIEGGWDDPTPPSLFFWQLYQFQLDVRVTLDLVQGMQFVGLFVVDVGDACVDENLEAMDAGGVGDVDRGVLDA